MLVRAVTETKSKSSDRLALVVGAVVALALLAWGISSVYSSIMLDVRGVEADGTVKYASFSRGTAEHPNRTACALTIELPGAGETHLRANGTDSTTCAGLIHTSLRVRYEPDDPENVRLAADGGLIVDIAVIATLAVALFVLVRVLRWAVARIRKMREDAKSSRSR
jgi:di/tricarboxylate transporter